MIRILARPFGSHFRVFSLIVLVCLGLSFDSSSLEADDRPNIILILADDFGYECVGANGGTSYKTPHLDRLAETGARFEHCYAQPLCTPTRVQLMTGQSNIRNYIRFGLLDPKQTTFAHLLKEGGYSTGIFGKWQLDNGLDGPKHFGFDEYCLWQLNRRPPRYANPGLEISGQQIDFTNGEYGPDLVQQHALRFVERNQNRPFFLYYPMILTHGPFQPTPDSDDWDPKAIGEAVNRNDRHFGDMVTYLDKHVGQLVSKLEECKLSQRTLILFVGDNGTASSLSSLWKGQTVQGGKSKANDRGMRVPLIVNWPGRIRPVVNSDLVDTTDFLPSICEAANVKIPEKLTIDGRSFLPRLLGRPDHPREWLYTWYAPNQGGRQDEPQEFARNHQYKLDRNGDLVKLDGRYGEEVQDKQKLDDAARNANVALQKVLDQFSNARPEELRYAAKPK